MKFVELKSTLTREIVKAYYIYGDDAYLRQNALELILNACKITNPEFNFITFDFQELEIKGLLDKLSTMPFFSERKLIVIKNMEFKNSQINDIVEQFVNSNNNFTTLVLMGKETDDCKLKTIEKVDCNRLNMDLLKKWVLKKLEPKKVIIENEALDNLILYTNGFLSKIDLEVKKLSSFNNITSDLVDSLVNRDLEYNIFELTESLGRKNNKRVFEIFEDLMQDRQSSLSLLGLIQNHFRRLFYVSISQGTNLELAQELGIKEFAVKKLKEQSKNFTKIQLKNITEMINETEQSIKSGKINYESGIRFIVVNILNI